MPRKKKKSLRERLDERRAQQIKEAKTMYRVKYSRKAEINDNKK